MSCPRAIPTSVFFFDMARGQDTVTFKLACSIHARLSPCLRAPKYQISHLFVLRPRIRGNQSSDCRGQFFTGECLAGGKPCRPVPSFRSWAASMWAHGHGNPCTPTNCRKRPNLPARQARFFCDKGDPANLKFQPKHLDWWFEKESQN